VASPFVVAGAASWGAGADAGVGAAAAVSETGACAGSETAGSDMVPVGFGDCYSRLICGQSGVRPPDVVGVAFAISWSRLRLE